GAIATGAIEKEDVICSVRSEASVRRVRALGFAVADNATVAKESEYLIIGVRPQDFPAAADSAKGMAKNVISIMAGIPSETISSQLGGCRVARAMPNLPCRIGYGMTGVDVSAFDEEEGAFILSLFASRGKAIPVREDQLHAVTGISGSGPAYVYYFIECLAKAGVSQGLSEEEARLLAVQTVIGGAKMVEALPEKSFSELVSSVCSKGGTTIRAIDSFRSDDLEGVVSRAVAACVERSKELPK
ncbi:MAG: pyrroline-5-carboxylate reductase, partial [Christensenellaceae bacterium]